MVCGPTVAGGTDAGAVVVRGGVSGTPPAPRPAARTRCAIPLTRQRTCRCKCNRVMPSGDVDRRGDHRFPDRPLQRPRRRPQQVGAAPATRDIGAAAPTVTRHANACRSRSGLPSCADLPGGQQIPQRGQRGRGFPAPGPMNSHTELVERGVPRQRGSHHQLAAVTGLRRPWMPAGRRRPGSRTPRHRPRTGRPAICPQNATAAPWPTLSSTPTTNGPTVSSTHSASNQTSASTSGLTPLGLDPFRRPLVQPLGAERLDRIRFVDILRLAGQHRRQPFGDHPFPLRPTSAATPAATPCGPRAPRPAVPTTRPAASHPPIGGSASGSKAPAGGRSSTPSPADAPSRSAAAGTGASPPSSAPPRHRSRSPAPSTPRRPSPSTPSTQYTPSLERTIHGDPSANNSISSCPFTSRTWYRSFIALGPGPRRGLHLAGPPPDPWRSTRPPAGRRTGRPCSSRHEQMSCRNQVLPTWRATVSS